MPEKSHVAASHFRATPFFLLHISFRAISLGLVAAFIPIWSWYLILGTLVLVNFSVSFKIFHHSLLVSFLTSFTSVLTPSLYPSDTPIHIASIANFHMVNSLSTTVLIFLAALINSLTIDLEYEWSRWSLDSSPLPSPPPCLPSSSDCSLPSSPSPQLPYILSAGILPPLLLAGVTYMLVVVLVMGIIRPGFLELPVTSASPASIEEDKLSESRVRSVSLDETRYRVTFGRGSAALPTIAAQDENNNMETEGEEDSSSTVAISEEELEQIVRLAEEDEVKKDFRFSLMARAPETELL